MCIPGQSRLRHHLSRPNISEGGGICVEEAKLAEERQRPKHRFSSYSDKTYYATVVFPVPEVGHIVALADAFNLLILTLARPDKHTWAEGSHDHVGTLHSSLRLVGLRPVSLATRLE